jgi:tetratricopeptide (TPR) repeat protein
VNRGRSPGGQRRRKNYRFAPGLAEVGLILVLGVTVLAPLAAGGVHRTVMFGLMAATCVGLVAFAAGLRLQGRNLRGELVLAFPLALLVVPLLQSIPLPYGLRAVLDPSGTSLLLANQPGPTSAWPMSLDPVATRLVVGRAAAALASFLLAYHLASGQSRRHVVLRAIGLCGVAAVLIGLGHRILGVERLYGAMTVSVRSLLVGPFVNANHTAELLELGTFACLACSFQRPSLLNRAGWLAGAVLCASGAAATLSRGAAAALVVGLVTFAVVRYVGLRGADPAQRRLVAGSFVALAALLGVGILALGADQLVTRLRADGVSTDIRFQVWRDGLRVLGAHPAGIGRGAFDRIFPIYRTVKMPFPIRFAFLENEPLQYLVDCGWFLTALIVAALGFVAYRVARHGRRDAIEAALCAGLVAVLAHSVVDFGLETMGVMLPFAALAGTLLGRIGSPGHQPARAATGITWTAVGLAVFGLVFGAASIIHRSDDNFDALLTQPHSRPERLALLDRAERTHPLDYLYALQRARLEPLAGSPSPRLHLLNRALRLCPSCETTHAEVAQNLWAVGLRRQALLEWRIAVNIQPRLLRPLLGKLFGAGATPEQLAAIASGDARQMLEVASFLADRQRLPDAFAVLSQADALGAPTAEARLARAALQLQAGDVDAAGATVAGVAAAGQRGPELSMLKAKILIKQKGIEGADEALAILDEAAARYPGDLQLERDRVSLVTRYKKWGSAARAIEGLKLACYRTSGSAAEAHIAAAEIATQLGRLTEAIDEYRIALSDRPRDVQLWMSYARVAESAGRDVLAREAYGEAGRISPGSPEIAHAQQTLEERQTRLRAMLGETDGRTQ